MLNFSENDWLHQVKALFFLDIYGHTMVPNATCFRGEWTDILPIEMGEFAPNRPTKSGWATDNFEGFGSAKPRQLGLAQQNGFESPSAKIHKMQGNSSITSQGLFLVKNKKHFPLKNWPAALDGFKEKPIELMVILELKFF